MKNEDLIIKKGLEGVVVDTTQVSTILQDSDMLAYRGYSVEELTEQCSFEEVAYLLYHHDLPAKKQLAEFVQEEQNFREISPNLLSAIKLFPKSAHPMDVLRTSISFLGMEDSEVAKNDPQTYLKKAMGLLAKIPTIIATYDRLRKGLEPILPRKDLNISENLFLMCFGKVPSSQIVKVFDVSLILYAEHGFNASTFTARVVASSQSDMYSAVTAAVGSLKGNLHGGANEEVMRMLLEIKDVSRVRDWLQKELQAKHKIMGFGHRVYKNGDGRAVLMKKYGLQLAKIKGDTKWYEISEVLEKTMIEEKKIYPNLDFPTGPAYYLMGFDLDLFTPIFVMSRISGWVAHILEQFADNRLIRPLSQYSGHSKREVIPLSKRG